MNNADGHASFTATAEGGLLRRRCAAPAEPKASVPTEVTSRTGHDAGSFRLPPTDSIFYETQRALKTGQATQARFDKALQMADHPHHSALASPSNDGSITREHVVAVYEVLLDRAPENEDVIDAQIRNPSFRGFLKGIAESTEFSRRAHSSPFSFYASMFDAEEIVRRHAAPDLHPSAGFLTNYLGVKIDPKFLPGVLAGSAGTVEGVPIPANWHADVAEWAAALRAVEFARGTFSMVELGCGWGCWMNITGVAARRLGLDVKLIGIEGDAGHIGFARESTTANGFSEGEVVLHRGIAAAKPGFALFPRQGVAGENWGLEPVFDASATERASAKATGRFDELPMIPLADVLPENKIIDLLHIDIQGGEIQVVKENIETLNESIAYILIGTHSRYIEGEVCEKLLSNGWRLEIERPAIVELAADGPVTRVDGVQGWRNLRLLP